MSKKEFLAQLRKGLSGLPKEDIEERLAFYSEMIEDRMEEGLSQEEAVMAAGDAAEIAAQIVADTPLLIIAKERIRPRRRLNLWEVVLLALGSPIWLSLGIAAAAVIFSLYVSFWAVIVSLWAVFASFAVCAVGGILACVVFIAGGKNASGFAMLAAGIICSGLSILMFMGCKAVSKGTLILTKKSVLWAKNCFIKKEEA
ncbi:MAG: DUF1700 domain-containing protein [Clostridia bacterium]|nr:DUF1700 domain-containing protein [Clostridia bacterium]